MRCEMHDYQRKAVEKIIDNRAYGLFFAMGLGKTLATLTAANLLMYDRFEIRRVLVIAPKKVAEDTWAREASKWDHLERLTVAKILGTAKQRTAAAESDADIYVVNRENVAWLVGLYGKSWKWDMIVIDELSNFKSPSSARFKALRKVTVKAKKIVGLTGTPSPNGLLDLWAQIYLLDRGERLGHAFGDYRRTYFKQGRELAPHVYSWEPYTSSERAISGKISDIAMSLQASDYLKLPDRIDNIVRVALDDKARKQYEELKQTAILEAEGITAVSAAALMTKLLQLSGGAIYDEAGEVHTIHTAKLEALAEILEATTEPVFVLYGYKHEAARLKGYFKDYQPRELKTEDDIDDWNAGRIRLLIAHPASVGYGLNLQSGGHILVWYSLPWSLELYQQATARLHRQGQEKPVIVHHLIAVDTVDEKVVECLRRKDLGQAALMSALKG